MRALVITHAPEPFGAAVDIEVVTALAEAIRDGGDFAEVVRLPFDPARDGARAVAAARMVNYSGKADLAVCLSPVASLVRHHRKVAWFDSPLEKALLADHPALDDRLLAECAMRYVRSEAGLASLRERDLPGVILPVPARPEGWAHAARKVIS